MSLHPGPTSRALSVILRDEAKRQHISQTELGKRVGLSQSQVSRLFRGERTVNVDRLQAICNVLGKSIHDVMREAEATASAAPLSPSS